MPNVLLAHQTRENPLCSRTVYVCAACGWWKPEAFTCRHEVTAADGDFAYRDYRAERCRFYLAGEIHDELAKQPAEGDNASL